MARELRQLPRTTAAFEQRTIADDRIVPLWCGEKLDLSFCIDGGLAAGS